MADREVQQEPSSCACLGNSFKYKSKHRSVKTSRSFFSEHKGRMQPGKHQVGRLVFSIFQNKMIRATAILQLNSVCLCILYRILYQKRVLALSLDEHTNLMMKSRIWKPNTIIKITHFLKTGFHTSGKFEWGVYNQVDPEYISAIQFSIYVFPETMASQHSQKPKGWLVGSVGDSHAPPCVSQGKTHVRVSRELSQQWYSIE